MERPMIGHAGPRGVDARRAYDAALLKNRSLAPPSRNSHERTIALADWEDAHDGPAVGFAELTAKWTERDDFGSLPYRVLYWSDDGYVHARDFWTRSKVDEFTRLAAGFD